MWVVTIFSIIGVILNVKRRRSSFAVWTFTNAAWSIYDFKIGANAQGVLFATYFVLAIWGWFEWKREPDNV